MTLEEGRTITCFLPRSSALEMVLSASANTLMRTMAAALSRGLAPVNVRLGRLDLISVYVGGGKQGHVCVLPAGIIIGSATACV